MVNENVTKLMNRFNVHMLYGAQVCLIDNGIYVCIRRAKINIFTEKV